MASDSQSAPIRAIGGRLKIRGQPTPGVGEIADRGDGQQSKAQIFGGDLPPKICTFCRPFRGGIRPREGFPRLGEPAPPTSPSAAEADGNGNWGRGLGESRSPSPLPSFSVAFRSSSAFPPMSCLKFRVAGPEISKPARPGPRPSSSIGAFRSSRPLPTAEGSPLRHFLSLFAAHRRFRR